MNENEFLKEALKGTPFENTHRIEVFVDGKFLLGTTTTHNPKNHDETVAFFKDMVEMLETPSVECTGEDL